MAQTETVVFNGVTYVRHPLARTRAARVYFTAYADGRRIKGADQLHVAVWKHATGRDVPPGYLVHHADFDPLNNDPANLACVTRKEHARLHEAGSDRDSPEWLAHLAAIRPLAAAWHASDEGRAWHRAHGRGTWAGRQRTTKACEECGASFEAAFERARFCSRACIQRAGRHRRKAAAAVAALLVALLAGCAKSDTYYKDCDAAHAAGAAPLKRGDDGYRAELDRDGNGVACET